MVKKKRVVRRPKPQSIVSDEIFIPNHSGMLDAGEVHRTPTDDLDPVNKKYVDNEVHWDKTGTGVHLKTSTDNVGIGTSTPSSKLEVNGQVSITGASRIRATRNTSQSIPHTVVTTILWNVEDYDNLGEYNPATGRFTVTETGYYSINAAVMTETAVWTNGKVVVIGIHVNGTLKAWGMRNGAAMTYYKTGQVHDILYLESDDYVEIKCYQNQGGAVGLVPNSIYNHFSVHRLS